ncbi:MAG: helix-turn-helix domain-containing protein [Brucellaceae bacterium]|nr:helix-turn-helix domain-containing protein [Brucellaceae bacterium]
MAGALKEKKQAEKSADYYDKRLAVAVKQMHDYLSGIDNGSTTTIYEVDRDEITAIRFKAGLSQDAFADRLGISVATLRNWEQGRRKPSGPARRLLDIIDKHPRLVMDLPAGE